MNVYIKYETPDGTQVLSRTYETDIINTTSTEIMIENDNGTFDTYLHTNVIFVQIMK